jgi:putative sporulation protein YyaC
MLAKEGTALSEKANPKNAQYWKKLKGGQLAGFLKEIASEKSLHANSVVFVCIGTDRSSGDALGPIVGTHLQEAGYPHVIGTLEFPCDASNITQRLQEIPAEKTVIAIDACLGMELSVGLYQVSNQPILPGKSVGKELPQVGDYTIAAIVNVNVNGPKHYTILQTTSLHKVMKMANEIIVAIREAIPRQAVFIRE